MHHLAHYGAPEHSFDASTRRFGTYSLLAGVAIGFLVGDWLAWDNLKPSYRKGLWPIYGAGVILTGAWGVWSAQRARESVNSLYDTAARL